MSIIKKYKSEVERVVNPIPGIYTVTFNSEKKFDYSPGQFLHLAIDEYDGTGQWPESRCFSMQSNPNNKKLKITFAVKGNFTRRMAEELRPGGEIWLKLPYGDIFQRGHSFENCVFVAGGTGLTPFLSLFTNDSFSGYSNPKLYFGVRSKEYDIFEEEIAAAKELNDSFKIKRICQDVEGILDVKKIHQENRNSTYFISGPPVMIKSFKNYLRSEGVEDKKIITDEWE